MVTSRFSRTKDVWAARARRPNARMLGRPVPRRPAGPGHPGRPGRRPLRAVPARGRPAHRAGGAGRGPGDLRGQRADLRAHPVQVGVRPGEDGVRVRLCVQGERQFPGEQAGAGPRVRERWPRGGLGEPRGQPRAVPGQRVQSGRAHRRDVALASRRVPQRGVHDLGDQRDRAGELRDRGFQMDPGHRAQLLPRRRQRGRDRGQPARDRGEPVR